MVSAIEFALLFCIKTTHIGWQLIVWLIDWFQRFIETLESVTVSNELTKHSVTSLLYASPYAESVCRTRPRHIFTGPNPDQWQPIRFTAGQSTIFPIYRIRNDGGTSFLTSNRLTTMRSIRTTCTIGIYARDSAGPRLCRSGDRPENFAWRYN